MDLSLGSWAAEISLILTVFCLGTNMITRIRMSDQNDEMKQKSQKVAILTAILAIVFATSFLAFGVANWQELSQLFLNH